MADTYRYGIDDVELKVTYADVDSVALDLSTLSGYGIELRRGSTLIGKYGYNLTGYTDSYYRVLVASAGTVQFNFPSSLFTLKGSYYARLVCNYDDATDFPDDELRDITSNKVNVFDIVFP